MPSLPDQLGLCRLSKRKKTALFRTVIVITRRSGGPRERVGFDVGEKLHRFSHTFFDRVSAVFDAAKGRGFNPVARLFPYVASANVQTVDVSNRTVQVVGANTRRQAKIR